jgi:hypothetical protein
MKPTENFKVEIYFNPLTANLADICAETDGIFSKYNMPCLVRGEDRRIYSDNGDPKDCGRLFAAIGEVSDDPTLLGAIADGVFDWGDKRENLMDNFFEYQGRQNG